MVAHLACADCSCLFPTEIGLSQHRWHVHVTQHNADKLGRVKNSGVCWSIQKSQSLFHLANKLYSSCDTQTALFARLEQYSPGGLAISIKTWLRVLKCKHNRTNHHLVALTKPLVKQRPTPQNPMTIASGLNKPMIASCHSRNPTLTETVSRSRRQLAHRVPVNRKPRQVRRRPDPIPPKTERCSVFCARWVIEGSIQRSAEAFGAPSPLVRYITQSYENAVAVSPIPRFTAKMRGARSSTPPIIVPRGNG
ncbi:hypothetical protein CLF_106076 [Clonorchis sinensis]|uniref:C2H2-type domain-containing protein n=1 Tax=Clonorchis sinensis TaxID=79923 RepID=G7YEN1_CLOSI|nr:hypothetical protein CLF_106076 [Clonorchis sinensis]